MYMVVYILSYVLLYTLCIVHKLSLSCPRSHCESTHGPFWFLPQETLWISTGEPAHQMGKAFYQEQSCCEAALHSDVSSFCCWLHPVLINNRASTLARCFFNTNPISGRQYLRRKHLGLLPLNPLWVRAGVLGCDSDHARKSNDGCLMTRMASPILTQLIYKAAAELPLPASPPTNPLCPS